ncbi:hypothetical protein GCM10022256_25050 [Frondihabitans peucedani]|uniref:Uncharacterized protein n=1 Tax=Frondihabitans peucedani TaxID=598626 RepID=A0ABP8E3V6_9MICO
MSSLAWFCLPYAVALDTWVHLVPLATTADVTAALLGAAALLLSVAAFDRVIRVVLLRPLCRVAPARLRVRARGSVGGPKSVLLASGHGARAPGVTAPSTGAAALSLP